MKISVLGFRLWFGFFSWAFLSLTIYLVFLHVNLCFLIIFLILVLFTVWIWVWWLICFTVFYQVYHSLGTVKVFVVNLCKTCTVIVEIVEHDLRLDLHHFYPLLDPLKFLFRHFQRLRKVFFQAVKQWSNLCVISFLSGLRLSFQSYFMVFFKDLLSLLIKELFKLCTFLKRFFISRQIIPINVLKIFMCHDLIDVISFFHWLFVHV